MNEQQILELLHNKLTINIVRFDAYFLEIELRLDGKVIDTACIDVPNFSYKD